MGFVPNGPAHAPVAPNDIGWATLAPTIVFTCTAFVVVVLRLYTRRVLIRNVGPEDFLISLSMVRIIRSLKHAPKHLVRLMMVADGMSGRF